MQIDRTQFIIQTLHKVRKNTLTCKIYYICIVDNHDIVLMNVQKFVVNRQHEHVSLLSPIRILKNEKVRMFSLNVVTLTLGS